MRAPLPGGLGGGAVHGKRGREFTYMPPEAGNSHLFKKPPLEALGPECMRISVEIDPAGRVPSRGEQDLRRPRQVLPQSSGALAMEAGRKRRRTGAVQDATARSAGFLLFASRSLRPLREVSS